MALGHGVVRREGRDSSSNSELMKKRGCFCEFLSARCRFSVIGSEKETDTSIERVLNTISTVELSPLIDQASGITLGMVFAGLFSGAAKLLIVSPGTVCHFPRCAG